MGYPQIILEQSCGCEDVGDELRKTVNSGDPEEVQNQALVPNNIFSYNQDHVVEVTHLEAFFKADFHDVDVGDELRKTVNSGDPEEVQNDVDVGDELRKTVNSGDPEEVQNDVDVGDELRKTVNSGDPEEV